MVGADRAPVAKAITCVGSIKWLENRPFAGADLSGLIVHRSKLPGADDSTPLLVISRSGVDQGLTGVSAFGPEDLITAWRTDS
ncbi:hypothetical protein NE236_40530 [Actinoallomurus purpureus]|uniref:hypothetical protein n=1 Tax=Actinoallomurus purpureus TaxID=478114 RepID=UPI0020923C5B|nr:hypothetical protein [Actinoallomurus purpureus]MCO6011255.1 hypothetical protein [Actinoallomurus purpureus]